MRMRRPTRGSFARITSPESRNTFTWKMRDLAGRPWRRRGLAQLLDELESVHGPVPQEEIDRALAMWADRANGDAE